MRSHSGTIGLLGKLPSHGDFLRLNIQGDVWKAFDGWIQEGFYHAEQRNAFQEGYVGAEGYAFCFSVPGTGKALVGYFKPSHDTIGRKYPAIVAQVMDSGISPNPIYQYDALVQAARHLLERATSERYGRDELNHAIAQLAESIDAQPSVAEDNFPGGLLWKDVFEQSGLPFDDGLKYLPFKNLVDIVFPLRNGIPAHYTLGFRFPGSKSNESRLHITTFWYTAFLQAVGQPTPEQCLFWRIGETASTHSSLLAFIQPPPAKVLVNMLPAESESDYICDMHHIGLRKKDMAAEALSASLRQVLDSPDASLAHVLQMLG